MHRTMHHPRVLVGLAGKIALVRNTNHFAHQSQRSRYLGGSGQQRNNALHDFNTLLLSIPNRQTTSGSRIIFQCAFLDECAPVLLSGCNETAPLDRYLKGPGDSLCRLLSFFQNLLRALRSSAGGLERARCERADDPEIGVVQSIGTRFSCCQRFHHPERLDAHAIDHAPCRIRSGGCRMGRMVSRAAPAALSHVLGRALSLSGFSVRRASRTGGQPHYPEPARSALHRYSDELHVPQRSVVVFLNADSVLFDLSPALFRSSPTGTVGLFVDRVRCRIFCALFFARDLATKWIVGPRWFCDLPFA